MTVSQAQCCMLAIPGTQQAKMTAKFKASLGELEGTCVKMKNKYK